MRAACLICLALVALFVAMTAAGCGRGKQPEQPLAPPPPADAWLPGGSRSVAAELAGQVLADQWINAYHDRTGAWVTVRISRIVDKTGAGVDVAPVEAELAAALAKVGERLTLVDSEAASHVLGGTVRKQGNADGTFYLVDVRVTEVATGQPAFVGATERKTQAR